METIISLLSSFDFETFCQVLGTLDVALNFYKTFIQKKKKTN